MEPATSCRGIVTPTVPNSSGSMGRSAPGRFGFERQGGENFDKDKGTGDGSG